MIEDDEDIQLLLKLTLESSGFEVITADSGPAGMDAVRVEEPDLITLDIGLPGMDGLETCRRIREMTDAYLVMVTARDDEIDRLIGLETGADDYLAKPFSARELRTRVNVLFRRPRRTTGGPTTTSAPARDDHEELLHGRLRVDVDGRRAYSDGSELELTRTEFDLLTQLMRAPARVWTREALLRSVWGTDWATDTHLVEVHIGNLRRKLGETRDDRFIRTVRGVGYRMESV